MRERRCSIRLGAPYETGGVDCAKRRKLFIAARDPLRAARGKRTTGGPVVQADGGAGNALEASIGLEWSGIAATRPRV